MCCVPVCFSAWTVLCSKMGLWEASVYNWSKLITQFHSEIGVGEQISLHWSIESCARAIHLNEEKFVNKSFTLLLFWKAVISLKRQELKSLFNQTLELKDGPRSRRKSVLQRGGAGFETGASTKRARGGSKRTFGRRENVQKGLRWLRTWFRSFPGRPACGGQVQRGEGDERHQEEVGQGIFGGEEFGVEILIQVSCFESRTVKKCFKMSKASSRKIHAAIKS